MPSQWPVAMKLPYSGQAVVSESKLVEYLLNPEHPRGRGKANFFLGLGFRRGEPDKLRRALIQLATSAEMTETVSEYGRKFVALGEIETPDGRTARVVTVWMLPDGAPPPQLITAYPSG
jgi:hypothetical protein